MPELQEVEIAARNLRAWLAGRRVPHAELPRSRVLAGDPRAAVRLVAGRTVRDVERRGKWLRLVLSGGAALYSHLGMTGKWVLREFDAPAQKYQRARLAA